jgi:tRNA G18 (ribose-2'-O)-methylase SpoU
MWRRCRTVLALASAHALQPRRSSMGQTACSLFSTNDDALDALRAVDSAQLLAEVARRNLDASDAAPPKSSHHVGAQRDKAADSDRREAELRDALQTLGVDADAIEGGPPKKAFQTYLRPRDKDNAVGQTPQNAAHQIAFLQRHELARRATHLRNTDLAAQARRAAGLAPHPLFVVLDNVRSAENVGSIYRSADCGRAAEVITCGFTPNPLSTSKLAKTAFGAESAVKGSHYESTAEALKALRARGVVVWALETVDGAVSYTTAPLPALESPGVALVFGNEVTGVDQALFDLVDHVVEIPTHGAKNSMNVACAATVVVMDVLRRWGVNDT